MPRDEQDVLFAEEMARSTRRFEDALRRGVFETYKALQSTRMTSLATSKRLFETSALLRAASRHICAESAVLREEWKRRKAERTLRPL